MSQFLRPDGNVTQSNFTGGFAEIDEATPSDADWAWGADSTAAVLEVSLSTPPGTPGVGTCTVRYRIAKTNDGVVDGAGNSCTVTGAVFEGTTQVVADTARTATGTWTEYTFTFASSAITDWTDVRLRFTTSVSGGSAANRRGGAVSWAELETPDAPTGVTGALAATAIMVVAAFVAAVPISGALAAVPMVTASMTGVVGTTGTLGATVPMVTASTDAVTTTRFALRRQTGERRPGIRFANNGSYDLAGTGGLGDGASKLWFAVLLRPTTNSPAANRYIIGCEKATSPFNGFTLRMMSSVNMGRLHFFVTNDVNPGASCQAVSGTLDPAKPRWLMVVYDNSASQHARMYVGDLGGPLTEVTYADPAVNGGGVVDLDTAGPTRIALGAIRVGGGAPLGTADWDGDIWCAAYGIGFAPNAHQIREFGIRPRPLPGEALRLYPGRDGLARIFDESGHGHHALRVGTTQALAARALDDVTVRRWGGEGIFAGQVTVMGDLAATVPMVTAALSADVAVAGALAATVPMVTASLATTVDVTGTLAASVPMPTVTMGSAIDVAGTMAATVPMVTATLTGAVPSAASLAATVPMPTAALTGEVLVAGTLAATVPMPTAAATTTVGVTGTLAASVPMVTASMSSEAMTSGTLDAAVPMPVAALTGAVAVSGTLAATVPMATVALTATVAIEGTLAASPPMPTAFMSSDAVTVGTFAASVPMPTAALTGVVAVTGTLSATAPMPVAQLSVLGAVTGTLAATAPMPVASMVGMINVPPEHVVVRLVAHGGDWIHLEPREGPMLQFTAIE